MKIQYLGTAASEGWPAPFCTCDACVKAKALGGKNVRTRSQAVIDEVLLVDLPPETFAHMLAHDVNLPHIHNCLVTHTHEDHLYLEELRHRYDVFAINPDGELNLYGNDALNALFAQKMGKYLERYGKGIVSCHELTEFVPREIGSHTVTALLSKHSRDEKCFIYLVEREEKRLLYGNDTGWFPAETWDYLAGKRLDLVSLDCITGSKKDGGYHMGMEDNIEVRQELIRIGCADDATVFVANHFSHNGKLLHHELEQQLEKYGFIVSYDGRVVEF